MVQAYEGQQQVLQMQDFVSVCAHGVLLCFTLLFLTFYPPADLKDKKCVIKDIKNFGSELVQMSVFLLTVLPIASLKKKKKTMPYLLWRRFRQEKK